MSEQPMYAYWDQQASQAVSAGTAAGTSSSLPQQQQQQQQSNSAPLHQQQQQQQQKFPLDGVNYSNSQIGGGNVPNQGFAGNMPHQQFAIDGDQNSNQQSVQQLQQNLMLMLQQQSEQNAAGNGSQPSHSPQQQPQQHPQHVKSTKGGLGAAKPSGMLPSHMFGASGNGDKSSDLMAQYLQHFGTQQEDDALPTTAPSSQRRMNETVSPSSSRLFALGGMVKPLPPNKQHASDKTGKPPEISASSLGMSESSSDFMMKLFQSDDNGAQPQQQQDYSNSFPFQQTSNPNVSTGGSATAALQNLQKSSQQQNNPMPAFSGDFSSQQQHQPSQDIQEQLRQKQEQLKFLQRQLTDSQPQQQGALELEPLRSSPQDDGFGLPCTMLPPSVLASMFSVETTSSKPKAIPHKAGKSHIKARKRRYNVSLATSDDATDMKPQDVLGELLERRNYDKEHRFKADDSGYDAVPSPLQLASFGTHLVKAVQKSDIPLLSKLLECGLSPNPCNQFRDSVFFDLVIKRSNLPVFECLLNHGCDLQVVDGFGRTPLHHCCWASTFCREIVEYILARDPVQIFLEDKHGQTPLEYVRANLYEEWNDFLEEVADKYWPMGGQPPRIMSPKERRPDGHLPDPTNALSVTLASMVSSGKVSPEQVAYMDENTRRSYDN